MIEAVFQQKASKNKILSFSFIEIYNEEITDLLEDKLSKKTDKTTKTLKISNANNKLEIKGLKVIESNSLEQAHNAFLQGSYVRKV